MGGYDVWTFYWPLFFLFSSRRTMLFTNKSFDEKKKNEIRHIIFSLFFFLLIVLNHFHFFAMMEIMVLCMSMIWKLLLPIFFMAIDILAIFWFSRCKLVRALDEDQALFDQVHYHTRHIYLALIKRPRLLSAIKRVKDVLCLATVALCLVRFDFSLCWERFTLYTIGHAVRPLFFMSTVLPRCSATKPVETLAQVFLGGNNDLIFSGHCLGVFLACHMLATPAAYIYAGLLSLVIITLREHYTIDVLVSLLMACAMSR